MILFILGMSKVPVVESWVNCRQCHWQTVWAVWLVWPRNYFINYWIISLLWTSLSVWGLSLASSVKTNRSCAVSRTWEGGEGECLLSPVSATLVQIISINVPPALQNYATHLEQKLAGGVTLTLAWISAFLIRESPADYWLHLFLNVNRIFVINLRQSVWSLV